MCAIVEKNSYSHAFDQRFKTEGGIYLEFILNDKSMCVIKHSNVESHSEKQSARLVMKGLKENSVVFAHYPIT